MCMSELLNFVTYATSANANRLGGPQFESLCHAVKQALASAACPHTELSLYACAAWRQPATQGSGLHNRYTPHATTGCGSAAYFYSLNSQSCAVFEAGRRWPALLELSKRHQHQVPADQHCSGTHVLINHGLVTSLLYAYLVYIKVLAGLAKRFQPTYHAYHCDCCSKPKREELACSYKASSACPAMAVTTQHHESYVKTCARRVSATCHKEDRVPYLRAPSCEF